VTTDEDRVLRWGSTITHGRQQARYDFLSALCSAADSILLSSILYHFRDIAIRLWAAPIADTMFGCYCYFVWLLKGLSLLHETNILSKSDVRVQDDCMAFSGKVKIRFKDRTAIHESVMAHFGPVTSDLKPVLELNVITQTTLSKFCAF